MANDATRLARSAPEALDLFIDAVAAIPPQGWDQPSNLDGWSVRELVGHATGSAAKVVALIEGGAVWGGPSQPTDWMAENPAARLRELAARLHDALPAILTNDDLAAPRVSVEGEVPLHRALAFPVADLILHSWDVHRSCGRMVELPDDLLAACRAMVESVPENLLRRPGGFGPAQPAPEGATATARLMAYLGRSVDGPG